MTEEDAYEIEGLAELRRRIAEESTDGARLVEDLCDNPICIVSVDSKTRCIEVTWQGYATSAQLRYVHENILLLLKKQELAALLGNDTALAVLHTEDQDWILSNWMPRALVSGLKWIANIRSEAYFTQVSVDAIQSNLPSGLVMKSFEDTRRAKKWLMTL